jgi:phosphoenolpyruvate carboxykinase (GTP)
MRKLIANPPRIFHVNWFRKDDAGNFLWPGFGENMRVLKWIVDRCHGRVGAQESPLGWVPYRQEFDLEGLEDFGAEQFQRLQRVDSEEWKREVVSQEELFINLHETLPKEMIFQKELLLSRL